MTEQAAKIARDPHWFPYRYEEAGDNIHFRRLTREDHRSATFLTELHLGEADEVAVISRQRAFATASPPGPVHFIFHSAFCGSTLLARAFDVPGVAMGLKEPLVLNDIAGWRLRGAPGARVAEVLDHAMALMARPMAFGETTIIKPSNVLNGLAPAMMQLRPDAKALLLRAPLDIYLKSIAKKTMEGRLWVRDLLVKQLREGYVDLGFEQWDYLGLTDLQAAAVGWLAQQAGFARLAAQVPERIRTLDSETLLARPREVMTALARLYSLALNDEQIAAIVEGPAFTTDSKTGSAFTLAERDAGYAATAAAHADEIAKVLAWTSAIAETAGIAIEPALPLG